MHCNALIRVQRRKQPNARETDETIQTLLGQCLLCQKSVHHLTSAARILRRIVEVICNHSYRSIRDYHKPHSCRPQRQAYVSNQVRITITFSLKPELNADAVS